MEKHSTTNQEGKKIPATESGLPNIRTMKSDAEKYIGEKKMSLIDIAAKEAVKRRPLTNKTKRKNIIPFAVIILFLISAGVLGFVIVREKTRATPSQQNKTTLRKSLVPSNQQKIIKIGKTKSEFAKTLQQVQKSNINLGEIVEYIFVDETEKLIDAQSFLNILGINPPDGFLNFLDKEFMFGVYAGAKNFPFLILRTSSFNHAFAEMLVWENYLAKDFTKIFNISPESKNRPFKDSIINNRDVRAIFNNGGEPLLLYSFIDQETLLITIDKKVLENILYNISIAR